MLMLEQRKNLKVYLLTSLDETQLDLYGKIVLYAFRDREIYTIMYLVAQWNFIYRKYLECKLVHLDLVNGRSSTL